MQLTRTRYHVVTVKWRDPKSLYRSRAHFLPHIVFPQPFAFGQGLASHASHPEKPSFRVSFAKLGTLIALGAGFAFVYTRARGTLA